MRCAFEPFTAVVGLSICAVPLLYRLDGVFALGARALLPLRLACAFGSPLSVLSVLGVCLPRHWQHSVAHLLIVFAVTHRVMLMNISFCVAQTRPFYAPCTFPRRCWIRRRLFKPVQYHEHSTAEHQSSRCLGSTVCQACRDVEDELFISASMSPH